MYIKYWGKGWQRENTLLYKKHWILQCYTNNILKKEIQRITGFDQKE